MGQENFYVYDGRINPIPCSVRQYVFDDINRNQSFKFFALLSGNSEVWWYYCSTNSSEVDRSVFTTGKTWFADIGRTERQGIWIRLFPQAPGTDGVLYNHENGLDDGSVNPPAD